MSRQRSTEAGFTLIELLVVVIIIGLLAAIAIPTFLRQREQAYQAQAVSGMRTAAGAIETWVAEDTRRTYVALDEATETSPLLLAAGMATSEWTSITVQATPDSYCIYGEHRLVSDKALRFDKGTGVVETGARGAVAC